MIQRNQGIHKSFSDIHLGLNLGHDRSAALVSEGRLLVAVEEERLDRIKHSPGLNRVEGGVELTLPWRAIQSCLEAVGADLSDLSSVTANSPGRDIGPELAARGFRGAQIHKMPSHHLAHAYTAWWPSGMDEAIVLVVDATGSTNAEGMTESYTLYKGANDELELLHSEQVQAHLAGMTTLGMVYEEVTRRIGFVTDFAGGFSQAEAGKTMGLAPYGGSAKNLRRWIEAQPGSYSLNIRAYDILLEIEALEQRHRAHEGATWMKPHLVELSAKVQRELEDALLHLVREAQRETGLNKLCLAGGVALNSVANHRLVRELGLDDFFAFPAAGDSGISAGCAWWASHEHGARPARRERLASASLGKPATEADIELALSEVSREVVAERIGVRAVLERSAAALAKGRVIARYEGGSEFGPRALGQRSILADPTFARMRDVLNARVKHREAYRPFAPVVPLEEAEAVFELGVDSPHMLLVAPVREELREVIPSVTHYDGTGRVQTVTDEANPFFHGLCLELQRLRGGPPVLLNTSYNVAGEPIVESPQDALRTFLSTDIDHLALEGWWISKRSVEARDYSDHTDGLEDAPLPRGLAADEPALDELMRELDAALFSDAPTSRWAGEELDEISARIAKFKETSADFAGSRYGAPVRSRLEDGRLLLLDPRNGAELIDSERGVAREVDEEEVKLLLGGERSVSAVRVERALETPEGATLAAYADPAHQGGVALASLREQLQTSGYTEGTVRARLKKPIQDLAPTDLPYLDRFGLERDQLGDLIRLFLLRGALAEERVRELVGAEPFELLARFGLLTRRGDAWAATVDLFPLDGLLVATDHRYQVLESDRLDEDPVMYLGRDSVGLVQVAPRARSKRHLDLCTGSGVQALIARRYAGEVVGVDRNPRAVRFARFNAELNGLADVQFLLGDLYQPVEGERFDTITANPPFVPSPVGELGFRDGGADGEAVLRRIVQEAAAHLHPDGRLSIVTDLVDVPSYEEKLQSWWRGGAFTGLMLVTADRDEQLFSVPHAHAPFGQSYEEFSEELSLWVKSYRSAGLAAVNFGYLVLECSTGAEGPRLVQRVIQSPVDPMHGRVSDLLVTLREQQNGSLETSDLTCVEGLRVSVERDISGRALSTHVTVPGDEWFTTYRLEPSLLGVLEEAAAGPVSLASLAQKGLDRLALVLLEKGLLVPASSNERAPEPEKGESWGTGSGVLLDELASKTTPTCVSNYLR